MVFLFEHLHLTIFLNLYSINIRHLSNCHKHFSSLGLLKTKSSNGSSSSEVLACSRREVLDKGLGWGLGQGLRWSLGWGFWQRALGQGLGQNLGRGLRRSPIAPLFVGSSDYNKYQDL